MKKIIRSSTNYFWNFSKILVSKTKPFHSLVITFWLINTNFVVLKMFQNRTFIWRRAVDVRKRKKEKKKESWGAGKDKKWVQYFKNELFVCHASSCLDLREVLSSENKEAMGITQESPTNGKNNFTLVSKGGTRNGRSLMILFYPLHDRWIFAYLECWLIGGITA